MPLVIFTAVPKTRCAQGAHIPSCSSLNMKKTILTFLFLEIVCLNICLAQTDSSETETHIFWTADRQLTMADFYSEDPSLEIRQFCDSIDLCWGAATGFYSVLDVAKKQKDKKSQHEEVYFAAAFDKTMSYHLNDDTLQFQLQKMMFNLQELAVRIARRDLQVFYDSMPAIGTKSIFFSSVKANAEKYHNDLVRQFTYEIYVKKSEGAYEKWKKFIEYGLAHTNEFKSTPRDTYRFVKGKPIKPKYVEAKNVVGNLWNE